MTKKGVIEAMDQGIGEAPAMVDAGEQLEYEDLLKLGAVEVDVTPESQVIEPEAMNKELHEEEQVQNIFDAPAASAPGERKDQAAGGHARGIHPRSGGMGTHLSVHEAGLYDDGAGCRHRLPG